MAIGKKLFLAILVVITMGCYAFGLAACGNNACGNNVKTRIEFAAPEISMADDGIYWANITGAVSYEYSYSEGQWVTAQLPLSFPTTDGDYRLSMRAVGENGKIGSVKEVAFKVRLATATATQADNSIIFHGDKIAYSVNGGEEGLLETDNKVLDFSQSDVGTEYTVSYYAKANYWSAFDATFYKDGEKKETRFKVSGQLASPDLQVKADGTGLEWLVSENAASYEITVDGEKSVVSKEFVSVAFPNEIGQHVIKVKALGSGVWTSGYESEYSMRTAENQYPLMSFNQVEKSVVWDAAYNGKVKVSYDGVNYDFAMGSSVSETESLRLKVCAYYDAVSKIYYLESKTISIAERSAPALKFDSTGIFSWGETDTVEFRTYSVSIVDQGEEPEFKSTTDNVADVSILSAGSYEFGVKNSNCVLTDDDGITLYIPSEPIFASFTVLSSPALTYENGDLKWEVDSAAEGYQCKKNSEEWSDVSMPGSYTADGMGTYFVRAVGSQTAPYSVNSGISELFFDPSLRYFSSGSIDYYDLATFNDKAYERTVSVCGHSASTQSSSISVLLSSDEPEEADILAGSNDGGVLKVVAGGSKRFTSHWASSDGVKFTLFRQDKLSLDSILVFRIYIKGNSARKNAPVLDATTLEPVFDENGQPIYSNLEGNFAFGASGINKRTGSGIFSDAIWYNGSSNPVIETDKWVEVSVKLGEFFIGVDKDGISRLQSVFCYFLGNGQEGDVFYIDEIRYESGITNEENDNRSVHLAPSILKSAQNYSVKAEESIPVYINEGTTENGDYIKFHCPVMISDTELFRICYDDLPIYAGDIINIRIKQYQRNGDLERSNSTINFYANGEYVSYVASSGEITEVNITVKADTTLKSFGFYAPKTSWSTRGRYTFEIYGVRVISSKNMIVEEHETPTIFVDAESITSVLPETVSYIITSGKDETGDYLHFVAENRIAGNNNILLSANYSGRTLNTGDKVILRVKMYPSETNYTDYTSTIHFYVNDAYSNWSATSGETVTFTYTASGTTALNNVQLRPQNSGVSQYGYFNVYVYGIEIIKNAAGTTFETPSYIEGAANVSIPLSASDYVIFANDNGTCFHIEAQNRVAGGTNVLFSANYQDVTLNAGDKVVMTLMMYPSETNYTDYTSTIHFYVNDAYSDWSATSGETVTFTYTASGTTALNNVQLRPQNSGVSQYGYFNVYVYGIEIVRA